jgi:glutamate racemase
LDKNQPIGVFDSGVGGLSVARELLRTVPGESILYYADTAHVPYGGRPLDEVRGFALHIVDFLVEHGAKLVVMACNISSATAVETAQKRYPDVPMIGVLRPGARAACATGAERIGVLATQGTVNSGAYERAVREADKGIAVLQVACPLFVPLVESGDTEGFAAVAACRESLAPLAAKPACDAIILGCTHYPFLLPALQKSAADLFDRQPIFVDPAGETARTVAETLRLHDLAAETGATPTHRFFASGDPERFRMQAPLLLGVGVDRVERG